MFSVITDEWSCPVRMIFAKIVLLCQCVKMIIVAALLHQLLKSDNPRICLLVSDQSYGSSGFAVCLCFE